MKNGRIEEIWNGVVAVYDEQKRQEDEAGNGNRGKSVAQNDPNCRRSNPLSLESTVCVE